jgi:hypothetical protein
MKKVKVCELFDGQLNWAVAKALGLVVEDVTLDRSVIFVDGEAFRPDEDWAQGGPIIERKKLGVFWVYDDDCWHCETGCTDENADEKYCTETGDTPLRAAMRCFVASELGNEIDVPDDHDEFTGDNK